MRIGDNTMTTMKHYYSNEFFKNDELHTGTIEMTQEQLQAAAKAIRENCKVKEMQSRPATDGFACTVYENENLGVTYWIKDSFGHISEIDEARKW